MTVHTLGIKNSVKIAVSCIISEINAFCTEIQDSSQKWQKNDFWHKVPHDSTYNLTVKNFVKISLFRTVSEINAFNASKIL